MGHRGWVLGGRRRPGSRGSCVRRGRVARALEGRVDERLASVEREQQQMRGESKLKSNGLGSCGDGVDCVSGMLLSVTYCLFRS